MYVVCLWRYCASQTTSAVCTDCSAFSSLFFVSVLMLLFLLVWFIFAVNYDDEYASVCVCVRAYMCVCVLSLIHI